MPSYMSLTSWQLPRLRRSYGETCLMDFGLYGARHANFNDDYIIDLQCVLVNINYLPGHCSCKRFFLNFIFLLISVRNVTVSKLL